MPIIRYVPCNPTDYVLQGMEMSDQSAGSPRREAQLTTVNATVADTRHLLMGEIVSGDTDTEMIGDDGFLTRRCLDSFTTRDMETNNSKILTPTGAEVQLPIGQRIMREYLGSTVQWVISGVTKNGSGSPLGNCAVIAFNIGQLFTGGNPVVAQTISDGSGNYSMAVPLNTAYELIAYLPGSPDVAGITVDSVMPAASG